MCVCVCATLGTLQKRTTSGHWNPVVPSDGVTNLYIYIHTVKASLPVLEQLISLKLLHLAHIVIKPSLHSSFFQIPVKCIEILMQGCPMAIWAIPTHCRAIPQEDMQTYILHTMGLQFILADSNPEQIFISLQWVMLRVAKPIDIKWPAK